jgi:hypothetical protein
MNATQAKALFKVCAWLVVMLTVAALAGLILTLPASQRKDGVIGVAAALVVLGMGFFGIYRVARAMEREDRRVEGARR